MATKSFKVLAAICAALAFAGANAATVSYSFTNPLSPTDINQTGSLALFDTSLGTLTEATLTVTVNLEGTVSLTNSSASALLARVVSTAEVGLGSSLPAVHQVFNHSSDITLSNNTGFISVPANSIYTTPVFSIHQTSSPDLSAALASLSAPGGGSFTLDCRSMSGAVLSGGGGSVTLGESSDANCGATLTYTYTPVPPPPASVPVGGAGMLGLMGIAMLGLAARLRRKP